MKHARIAIALLLTLAAPVEAQPAASPSPPAYDGPKWEYRIEQIISGNVEGLPGIVANAVLAGPDSQKFANLGKDGWELVSVTGGRAYFKRQVLAPKPHSWWRFW